MIRFCLELLFGEAIDLVIDRRTDSCINDSPQLKTGSILLP